VRLDHLLSRVPSHPVFGLDRLYSFQISRCGNESWQVVSYHFSVVECPHLGLVAQLVRALC
jgi:hypothetical protein